jgi:hypothetical protein
LKLPRGRWFGRGFAGYGRGYGTFGWSGGFGNPYPFCRWFPWLPRRWWAYPGYGLSYYGGRWLHPYYTSYYATPYMTPYRYAPY